MRVSLTWSIDYCLSLIYEFLSVRDIAVPVLINIEVTNYNDMNLRNSFYKKLNN